MAAMFGWLRLVRICASRVNRASRSGSLAKASGRIFSATWRLSCVSVGDPEPAQRGRALADLPALLKRTALGVFAKYVVHPEHSEQNGVAKPPFQAEEAPDEDSS